MIHAAHAALPFDKLRVGGVGGGTARPQPAHAELVEASSPHIPGAAA